MNTCLTLFSGGGLADIGLKAAGYTPVGAVEWDAAIAEVYALNHGSDHLKIAGVEKVCYTPYAGVTLAWVSPCCTNASVANSEGKESEADLSAAAAICRMLREARPLRFVLENVYGYRNFRSFQMVLRTLQELGYAFTYEHLNFADYSVPQTRKRLILRAVLGARYVPPLCPTHCEGGDAGGLFAEEELPPWVGWYAAIEDLMPSLAEGRLPDWVSNSLPSFLGTSLIEARQSNSWGEQFRKENEPCFSVSAYLCEAHCPKVFYNSVIYNTSPRALARFQSVPDTYQLPENKKLACRVIGNGVPSLGTQRIAASFER